MVSRPARRNVAQAPSSAAATRSKGIDPDGYTYAELKPLVHTCLDVGLSVLVRGHPGVGKSAMAAELSERMDLPMQDIRLAQRDPAEIAGVYFPSADRTELALLPPPWVRQACAEPTFVFLDEINAAVTRLHQAAAYQIVLERRVGPFRFHPGTVVLAAGNLDEDRAIVTPLSSALANRFAHFTLRVDVPAWVAWADSQDLVPQVVAYMRANQMWGRSLLYDNNGEDAFPTPRSWAMAAQVLARCDEAVSDLSDSRASGTGVDAKRLVAACIGTSAAQRFFAFLRLYDRLNPERVIARGAVVDFTSGERAEPSFAYAAITAVGRWIAEHEADWRDHWADNLIAFVRSPGLDIEYAFLLLRDLRNRTRVLERLREHTGFRVLAGEIVQMHAEALR